jgi:potassium-dependent mechanosensitive channel
MECDMRSIIFFFVFLWSINASAINPLLNDNLPQFNLKKANQTFDRINLQLSVQNLNLASLKNAISTLSTLTSEADQCVEDAEKRLNTLITLMKENADSSNQTTTGADKLYLSNEQKAVSSKQASCRLFSIRSKEAINAYKIAISKLKQKETLSKRASLFTLINRILAQPSDVPLAQMPLLDALSEHPIPVLWIGLTSITILIIMLLSFTVLIRAQKNRLVRHHIYWTHFRIKHALLLSVWLLSATVFSGLLIVLQEADSVSPLIRLSQWAFFYTTAVVLTVIFFKIKQIRSLFTWHLLDINFYRAALLTFISFYALSILGHTFAKTVALNGIVWQVLESCFLLTMIATGIYFIYYFCKTHRHLIVVKRHRRAIQRVTVAVFLAYAVLDCLGYYLLAMRLTLSGLSTFAILLGTILLIQGIHKSYFMLCHQPHITANIVKYFGYKKDQAFTEFLILKITAQVVVLALSVYLIVRVWGFATYILESTYTQLGLSHRFASVCISSSH